jgi:hypothetical protein
MGGLVSNPLYKLMHGRSYLLHLRLHSMLDCATMVVLHRVRLRIEASHQQTRRSGTRTRQISPERDTTTHDLTQLGLGCTQRLKETRDKMLIGEHELPKASSFLKDLQRSTFCSAVDLMPALILKCTVLTQRSEGQATSSLPDNTCKHYQQPPQHTRVPFPILSN